MTLSDEAAVGVVGCGTISETYLPNLARLPGVRVVACADLVAERAEAAARRWDIPRACSVDELLADPSVEIVLNLTIPRAHVEVSVAALEGGKHVHTEKPLAIDRAGGERVLAAAASRSLRVGAAPDTFLSVSFQTGLRLLDDGAIGRPVSASATMVRGGPELNHPWPESFYQPGAGPLFDMGPYYVTTLVSLLGPAARVTAATATDPSPRTIATGPNAGSTFHATTPTHVAGILEFTSGPIATLMTSFDARVSAAPRIEIQGTEGSLWLPDPNAFGGRVRLRRFGEPDWTDVPVGADPLDGDNRGIGLVDMADAIRADRPHRASGELAYHVLDVMQALYDSAAEGRHQPISSTVERPAPF